MIYKCIKCNADYPTGQELCISEACLTHPVYFTEKLKDGGILTHIQGYMYPFKGSPDPVCVGQCASVKRAFISTARLAMSAPFKYLVPLFFILPTPTKKFILKKLVKWVHEVYIAEFKKVQLPDIEFCASARELIRAGKKLIASLNVDVEYEDWLTDFMYCFVMFYEYDSAYRNRPQDLFAVINRENLLKNPRKEILRVFEIWSEREINPNVKPKFTLVSKPLMWGLFLSPLILKIVTTILLEIDLEKVKPDKGDWYWMCDFFDYNYGGKTFNERQIEKRKMEKGWIEKPIDPLFLANIAVLPNGWVFKLTPEQVEVQLQALVDAFWDLYQKNRK